MSTRLMIGSSMVRGRSLRILAIWSFTSLSARSTSTEPTVNWITVDDDPSVAVEMMCQTPLILETASSTFFVTCDSSSDGAAPDWVMSTCTIGISMFGKRGTDLVRKLMGPRTIKTANATAGGMGRRIDQAETLSRMGKSNLAARGRRRFGDRPHPGPRPQDRK